MRRMAIPAWAGAMARDSRSIEKLMGSHWPEKTRFTRKGLLWFGLAGCDDECCHTRGNDEPCGGTGNHKESVGFDRVRGIANPSAPHVWNLRGEKKREPQKDE